MAYTGRKLALKSRYTASHHNLKSMLRFTQLNNENTKKFGSFKSGLEMAKTSKLSVYNLSSRYD